MCIVKAALQFVNKNAKFQNYDVMLGYVICVVLCLGLCLKRLKRHLKLEHNNRRFDKVVIYLCICVFSGEMSGYTFIDNSELSVCEKIKQYFEKNQAACVDSSFSSSSSCSIDFDASFQKVLFEHTIRHQSKVPAVEASQSDEAIDLCSPPVGMSPQTTIESNVRPLNKLKTVNLISFTDSNEDLEMLMDVNTTHPIPHLFKDNSFNFSDNTDSWRKISDESFERDEAMCASILQDNVDETQLIDVEAPSSLWDQSIDVIEDSVARWKSVAGSRRLPSTIMEESEINSETSQESTQYQPDHAISTYATSECVLLKPTVIPSNSAQKIENISSPKSILQSTTKKSYYRPSMMNVFPLPTNKKRNFFFPDSSETSDALLQSSTKAPVNQMLTRFEKSHAISKDFPHSKNKPLLTTVINPFTYPESSPASPFDHGNISANSSNQLSPVQPDFNDTLEAVEFFMEKGKQLQARQVDNRSIQEPSTPPDPTVPLLVFSPKSNNKISDTIRKRLLIRNFVSTVNEATSPIGTSNPLEMQRIGELELMARRSVNKSPNDSYWD